MAALRVISQEDGGKQVRDANANLIAAAPDLLEALKKALYEVEGFEKRTGVPQFGLWISRTKKAIAKAEGQGGGSDAS